MFILLGTVALREIGHNQKSTKLLIRKLPFLHLVRDIAYGDVVSNTGAPKHWQPGAIGALQEAVEAFLVRNSENKSLLNSHCVLLLTSLRASDTAISHPREASHGHVKRHYSHESPPRDHDGQDTQLAAEVVGRHGGCSLLLRYLLVFFSICQCLINFATPNMFS